MVLMDLFRPFTQRSVGAPFRAPARSSEAPSGWTRTVGSLQTLDWLDIWSVLSHASAEQTWRYIPSSLFKLPIVTICVDWNDNVILSAPVARGRWVYLTWKSTVWPRSCLGPWWWCPWSWWACSTSLAVGTCRSFAFCCSSLKLCPLGAISNSQNSFICMFWTLWI